MRAAVMTALILALLVGGEEQGHQEGGPTRLTHLQPAASRDANRGDWRWETCRFARYDDRPGHSPDEVRLTLRCAARRWDAPLDLAFRIVGCESGFDAASQNSRSSAGGVWQAIDSTWASWKARYSLFMERWSLRGEKYNGRANGLLGFRILSEDGTGPWRTSEWCWG